MADSKTGMEKNEMKMLLAKASKDKPVRFAFGLGADTSVALLFLDKTKQPRAVEADLTAKFPQAKNTRFGTCYVGGAKPEGEETGESENEEAEAKGKIVKFYVNKMVSSMAAKLVKTLKGTSYSKVEILMEDGTLVEGYEEAEEGTQQTQGQPQPETQQGVPEPPAPPPMPPQTPALDAGKLQQQLAALIARIPQVAGNNANFLALLKKLAIDATTSLKTGNLVYAAAQIEQLRKALDEGAPAGTSQTAAPAAQTAPPPQQVNVPGAAGAVAYGKSRLAWLAIRKKMEGDIEKLRGEIVAHYSQQNGGNLVAEIEKKYQEKVGPVLVNLDESLADKLDEAVNASEANARSKLVQEARDIIGKYQQFVSGSQILADLDKNPFVPLAIQQTLTATLTTLSAAVR
ncbi:MAG TPA: hypothetical protein VKS60_21210 [Stellaceae bacterium]|nr:hypothetical protein [Stellaceae bacterium]